MWFRSAPILVAGLALSGCAGGLGDFSGFGGSTYTYSAQPYEYAYGPPYYGEYTPGPPAYGAPYAVSPTFVTPFVYEQPRRERHDWDRHERGDWSRHDWDGHHGQPGVWAGRSAGAPPAHVAPPPAPHPAPAPARDPSGQAFMKALGIKPDR
jgi:hypothetical protein